MSRKKEVSVTDPNARLTETAHGELRSKVEQLYCYFTDTLDLDLDLTPTSRRTQLTAFPDRRLQPPSR